MTATSVPFHHHHLPLSFGAGGLHSLEFADFEGMGDPTMDPASDAATAAAAAPSSSSQLPPIPHHHPYMTHSASFPAAMPAQDQSSPSASVHHHHGLPLPFAALSSEILARRPHATRASSWQPSSVPTSIAMEPSAASSAWGIHSHAMASSSSYAVASTSAIDLLPQSAPSTVWAPGIFGAVEADRHQSFAISPSGDYGVGLDPRSSSHAYEVPFAWSPPAGTPDYPGGGDFLVPRQGFVAPHTDLGVSNPFDPLRLPLPTLQIPSGSANPAGTQPLSAGSSVSPTSHFSPGLGSSELEPSTLSPVHEDEVGDSPSGGGEEGSASPSVSPTHASTAIAGGVGSSDTTAPRPSKANRSLRRGHMDTFSIWPPGQRPPIIRQDTRPQKPVTDPELRKYRCELCGKAFKRSGTFNQHKRTHTGERPHVCTVVGCGKAFQTTSNLKRHIRTHRERPPTGQQPVAGTSGASSSNHQQSQHWSAEYRHPHHGF